MFCPGCGYALGAMDQVCSHCGRPQQPPTSLALSQAYCLKCNTPFPPNSAFCPQCGNPNSSLTAIVNPAPRPAASGPLTTFRCQHCGASSFPMVKRRISTGGWIAFGVLLVLCFPLFWIGLLIKEDYRVCGTCLAKLD